MLRPSARVMGMHEDNKNLKLSLSKVEAERKQVQERSNTLEKVSTLHITSTIFIHQNKYSLMLSTTLFTRKATNSC